MIPKSKMIEKAKYCATINQNEVENKAIDVWDNILPTTDKEWILEQGGHSPKHANLSFNNLTPELKEMVKFITLNIYNI